MKKEFCNSPTQLRFYSRCVRDIDLLREADKTEVGFSGDTSTATAIKNAISISLSGEGSPSVSVPGGTVTVSIGFMLLLY